MIEHLKKHKYLYALALIFIIAYHSWFSFHIFSAGDWGFMHAQTAKDYFYLSVWNAFNNFGAPDTYVWRLPLNLAYGAFGLFGFDKNISEKFIVFLPTFIAGILGIYLLVKHYFNKRAAFVATLVVNFNTYYLASSTHILLYTAGVFGILATYAYILALERKELRYYVLTALLIFISGVYDIRLLYFMVFTISTFALFNNLFYEPKWRIIRDRSELKSHIIMLLVILGLFAFWISAILSAGALGDGAVLGRNLFGNEYWSISAAMTLFHPFWTGGATEWFVRHNVLIHFWIIPLFALGGLVYARKRKIIFYFAFLALFGILLAKQVDYPFPGLYPWLYSNLPGFNAFREATKFYYFITFGYAFLIAAFIYFLNQNEGTSRRNQLLSRSAFVIISIVFIANLYPVFTNKLDSMRHSKSIPSDYSVLSDFLEDDKDSFKTLWIPRSAQWTTYTAKNPKIDAVDIAPGFSLQNSENQKMPLQRQVFNMLSANEEALLRTDIKYVIVPMRDIANDNDVFIDYGDDRNYYVDNLDKMASLSRVNVGTQDVIVYANKKYVPTVTSMSNLYHVNDITNINDYATYAKNNLNIDRFSITSKTDKSEKLGSMVDLFESIDSKSISSPGRVAVNQQSMEPDLDIVINANKSERTYTSDGNTASFQSKFLDTYIVDNEPIPVKPTQTIQEQVRNDGTYLVTQADVIEPLDTSSTKRNLPSENADVYLYEQDSANIFHDSSLKYKIDASDNNQCEDTVNGSVTSILQNQRTDTNKFNELLLKTRNHLACIKLEPIKVKPNETYILALDYKVFDGTQAGYEVSFNNNQNTVRNDFFSVSQYWSTNRKEIKIPSDVTSMTVTLKSYPPGRYNTDTTNYYSNIRVNQLLAKKKIFSADTTKATTISKVRRSTNITYINDKYDYKNLVKNGSFESGLWQSAVGDCNKYDSSPNISMDLINGNASEGRKSLQLTSIKHTACTSPARANVIENGKYLMSFDYTDSHDGAAGFNIQFNDASKTSISERVSSKDEEWKKYNRHFTVPYGATNARITIYSYPEERGKKATVQYDNLKLIAIPDISNQVYGITKPEMEFKDPHSITSTFINPTKRSIKVTGAKYPFYLVVNTNYHASWKLIASDKTQQKSANKPLDFTSNHIAIDDYLNGWAIYPAKLCTQKPDSCEKNQDGSYDINLVTHFQPQRTFTLGLIISGGTLLLCLGYLSFYQIRKMRPVRNNTKGVWRARR